MKNLTCNLSILLLTGFISPSDSFADSWICHYAELTRNVVIFYPNSTSTLPCKVYYTKPDENVMPRTLWKAEHDDTYCERKAAEFIQSLESKGWQCSVDYDEHKE
jgi:hypothetical protein